jgi:hypothetical protein
MASIDDPIWTAIIATEDAHGENAEDHARCEAGKACRTGHMREAAIWEAAADDLHALHLINRVSARPSGALPLLRRTAVAPGAAAFLA